MENIPFEFQEVLEEVVNLQATSAHEKGLEITLKIDPKIPRGVVGDPLRIQQVLTNLVGNSIKFTERGNIDVSVEMRALRDDVIDLQFMVRDTGIGISERQQAQLFQAFSQADASISRRYGGTGLGLVITQKLVSHMGGEISLTSRLHQGSTFWFTLRLHTTELPLNDGYNADSLNHRHLLLIEPNMQAAAIVQQTLVQSGLEVTYRSAIPEEQHVYDYVLLNLAPSKETNPTLVELWVQRALAMTHNVIVGVPSTELALADQLMQRYPVKCISKPLSRKNCYKPWQRNSRNSPIPVCPNLKPISFRCASWRSMIIQPTSNSSLRYCKSGLSTWSLAPAVRRRLSKLRAVSSISS